MGLIRECEIVVDCVSGLRSGRVWLTMTSTRLIRTIGLYLVMTLVLCVLASYLMLFAHATEDYVVSVNQSDRRLPKVTVTASRHTGGSGILSISITGGGRYSPFGGYGPFEDEYLYARSCSRRRNKNSDLCKNLCWMFPESAKCREIGNNRNKSNTNEDTLPTVTVTEEQKKDDRKKLKLLNQSGPVTLILDPVEAVVPCYTNVRSRPMRFPKGTHKERSIVTGEFYTVQFVEDRLYKLVREVADELALPGKDGKAVDWRRHQEGGFYIYWNRKTGRFRIGQITLGELYSSSVSVDYRNDKMTSDEVRIARFHTQPSGTDPSFQDIFSSKSLVERRILSSAAKEFIASVKIDEFGREYVEIKMFDFISFPWSKDKIIEYKDKQKYNTQYNYPYEVLAEFSVEILQNSKVKTTNKVLTDC